MTTTTTAPAAIAQPIYVDQTWHEAGDGLSSTPGDRQYRETDDPRLLAVVELDSTDTAPDGDAFAPACWAEYRGGWRLSRAGHGFDDDEAAEAVVKAWDQWGQSSPTAARYLLAFHGVIVHEMRDSSGDLLVILDTPAHRGEVAPEYGQATAANSEEWLSGTVHDWRAYLDGDVWGVGYALNLDRTSHDEPVDLDEGWTVELESWGYFGSDWAHEAALELDGAPTADELESRAAAAVEAAELAAARAAAPAAVRAALTRYDELEARAGYVADDERAALLDDLVEAVRPLL